MKSKKAQIWGIDLMVGFMLFSFGIMAFYIYSINTTTETKENFEYLSYDGNLILNNILSEGYPPNWDSGDVVVSGILSNNKINETKLENFKDLVGSEYSRTKTLFNTKYDYYFFLDENMTINSLEVEGIGRPGYSRQDIIDNSANLIKITKFTIYKEKPMTAFLYIWDE